ncbi:MAG: PAS domain-containing protein [Desulfobacteraceae bacterium]|nr:PAS domain-containing protein [Desulfobacteraceae bacterium]
MPKKKQRFTPTLTTQAPEKAAENTSKVFELLDKSNFGIIVFDGTNHLIYINRYAQQVLDVHPDNVMGKPAVSFIDDEALLRLITQESLDSERNYDWRQHSLLVKASKFCDNNLHKGCLLLLQKKTPVSVESPVLPPECLSEKISMT